MFSYFLRFPSPEVAHSYLNDLKGDPVNVALDFIGVLYTSKPTGVVGEDGEEIYDTVPKEGYHVNVLSREEIFFDSVYCVEPSEPVVKFAGQ